MDVRIPKIRIRTRHVKQISNQRLVIVIDEWDMDCAYPNGHIVRQLGPIGDLETEIQGAFSFTISNESLAHSQQRFWWKTVCQPLLYHLRRTLWHPCLPLRLGRSQKPRSDFASCCLAFNALSPSHPINNQIQKRKDIRDTHRVYSIDPIGCQDIDDALSLRFLPDGGYELGVRILKTSSPSEAFHSALFISRKPHPLTLAHTLPM